MPLKDLKRIENEEKVKKKVRNTVKRIDVDKMLSRYFKQTEKRKDETERKTKRTKRRRNIIINKARKRLNPCML